jgi:hypothetical protein
MGEKTFKEFLSKNLRFLRKSLGFDLPTMADIYGVDPIDLYEIEEGRIEGGQVLKTRCDTIVQIANYYTIRLEVLYLEDLEEKSLFPEDLKERLLQEFKSGDEVNRSRFYRDVYENCFVAQDDSPVGVAKQIVSLMHQTYAMQTKYRTLRKRGVIPKSDFFEGSSNG